jgi:hypothetical protein
MGDNVAQFERLIPTALLTDRVFWPIPSVEMSGLYRVSHEHDHAPADEVLCIREGMFLHSAVRHLKEPAAFSNGGVMSFSRQLNRLRWRFIIGLHSPFSAVLCQDPGWVNHNRPVSTVVGPPLAPTRECRGERRPYSTAFSLWVGHTPS